MKILKSVLNWQGIELTYEIDGEVKHVDEDQECACKILKEAKIIEDYTVFSEEDVEVMYEAGDDEGNYFMEVVNFEDFARIINLYLEDWIRMAEVIEKLTTLTLKEVV